MTGRLLGRVGTLLLVVVPIATGVLSLALGAPSAAVVVVAHGGLGLAVTAALARVARRDHRVALRVTALLVALAATLGVLLATGIVRSLGGHRALSVHVAVGVLAVVAAAGVIVTRRRAHTAVPTDLGRRRLVQGLLLVVAGVAGREAIEGATHVLSLPGTNRRFTGSYVSDPFPVTQWLSDRPLSSPPADWKLALRGGEPRVIGYAELSAFRDVVRATLDCTNGWYSVNEWEGVRLDRLIVPHPSARSIEIRSVTGYSRRFPLADVPRLLLATRVDGKPLEVGHGYPLRLVATGRRGFWWVKWVDTVELSNRPWWWQLPFPAR